MFQASPQETVLWRENEYEVNFQLIAQLTLKHVHGYRISFLIIPNHTALEEVALCIIYVWVCTCVFVLLCLSKFSSFSMDGSVEKNLNKLKV